MSYEVTILNKIQELLAEYIEYRQSEPSNNGDPRKKGIQHMGEPSQTFTFIVDSEGNFTYDPPGKWGYNGKGPIRIESPSGQFKITGTPVASGWLGTYKGPWGEPRTAKQDSTKDAWYVEIDTPYDADYALPPTLRKAVVDTQKYIARFNYEIEVNVNGRKYVDNTKNGEYSC